MQAQRWTSGLRASSPSCSRASRRLAPSRSFGPPVVRGALNPPLHVHSTEDELFLVIDGHVSFFTDGRWTDVGPGGVVYFPRGTPHSYHNRTDTTCHLWVLTTPSSAFDVFLERLAEQTRQPGGPDMDEILAMHRDHNITLLGPV